VPEILVTKGLISNAVFIKKYPPANGFFSQAGFDWFWFENL
jgi:hypothetical protein